MADTCGVDGKCTSEAAQGNCDDGQACTLDTCDAKTKACKHAVTPNKKCQLGDSGCLFGVGKCASDGVCEGTSLTASCDDKNPCTIDLCDGSANGCTHEALPTGTSCGKDLVCTAKSCGKEGNVGSKSFGGAAVTGQGAVTVLGTFGNPGKQFAFLRVHINFGADIAVLRDHPQVRVQVLRGANAYTLYDGQEGCENTGAWANRIGWRLGTSATLSFPNDNEGIEWEGFVHAQVGGQPWKLQLVGLTGTTIAVKSAKVEYAYQ